MRVIYYTNRGGYRENNQDTLGILQFEVNDIPMTLAIVCDGMGGGEAGKLASELVTTTIIDNFKKVKLGAELDEHSVLKALRSTLLKSVYESNANIYSNYGEGNSGTTLVYTIIGSESYCYGHCGDSRLYLNQEQVTVDHTWVRREYELGKLTEEQMYTHPKRHVLSRAIGVSRSAKVDNSEILPLSEVDSMLLVSDGYFDLMTSVTMSEVVQTENLELLATAMIDEGQRDNLTAILIKTKI